VFPHGRSSHFTPLKMSYPGSVPGFAFRKMPRFRRSEGPLYQAIGRFCSVHLSGFEPETFGSVDRIAGASKAIPTNELRTFAKSPAAFEQHPNDNSSHSMSPFDSSSCSLNTGSLTCCDRDSTEIAQLILRWPTLPRQVQEAILLIAKVPVQTNPIASTKSNEPSERDDAVNGGAS
jgi:hypothetical protein